MFLGIKAESAWGISPSRVLFRVLIDLQIPVERETLLKNVDDEIKTTTKSRTPCRCSEYPFG